MVGGACGNGGEGGIRTLEGFQTLLVFETSTFNRSVTSPWATASIIRGIAGLCKAYVHYDTVLFFGQFLPGGQKLTEKRCSLPRNS